MRKILIQGESDRGAEVRISTRQHNDLPIKVFYLDGDGKTIRSFTINFGRVVASNSNALAVRVSNCEDYVLSNDEICAVVVGEKTKKLDYQKR